VQEREDLEAFVQRNVQAAVQAARDQDIFVDAQGSNMIAPREPVASLEGPWQTEAKDASISRDHDSNEQEPVPSFTTIDQLNISRQPQVTIRLQKARIKVRMLHSNFLG
jgi:hypothetical protein